MSTIETSLFPFPHIVNGERRDGSIIKWPSTCTYCSHQQCRTPANEVLALCSYGYNYQRIDEHTIVAGVLLRDSPSTNPARNKRFKNEQKTLITKQMLDSAVSMLTTLNNNIDGMINVEKKRILDEYLQSERYKTDFLEAIRPEILKGLSFVHDYKQINSQIRQNINVIIENKYLGASIDDKLSLANREEKAIYEASRFLEEKINVAKFLLQPEWLDKVDECSKFRFHGLILKYVRIYQSRFDKKHVNVTVIGRSFSELIANSEAVAVIPHTLIDNAAKYSPHNGKVEVYAQDVDDGVEFSVSSYGPSILEDEQERIFSPFYRGIAAKKVEEEGAGYGLYICQLVATKHLGTRIQVKQDPRQTPRMGHWTTFSIHVPARAVIVS